MTEHASTALMLNPITGELVIKLIVDKAQSSILVKDDELTRKLIEADEALYAARAREDMSIIAEIEVKDKLGQLEERAAKVEALFEDAKTIHNNAEKYLQEAKDKKEAADARVKSLDLRETGLNKLKVDLEQREATLKDRTQVFVKSLKSGRMSAQLTRH